MRGFDTFGVEPVEMLPPGPRDVVVRIEASGVCHSDLSVLNGDAGARPPLVLGHEGAGVVEWTGDQVGRVQVGDRVIASLGPVCGVCWHCRHDETHLCEAGYTIGAHPRVTAADGTAIPALAGLGTFAEAMTVSEWSLVPVTTDLPADELALLGCGVTTGLGAVLNTAAPRAGDSVCVIGCGGVGLAAVQGAQLAGAGRVIAIDPVAAKREIALRLGATDAIDPGTGDVLAQVRELTDGRGVDVAIEAVGVPALAEQAVAMTRRGGTAVLVGAPRYDAVVSLAPMSLIFMDRTVKGCHFGDTRALRDLPRYVGLIESGRLDLSSMVSRHVELHELPDVLAHPAGDVIRHVVV